MSRSRTRERFDEGWRFFRGEIRIPETVKAGVLGGLADVIGRKKGKHMIVAFVDREMRHQADPDKWPEVTLPHDWCVEGDFKKSKDQQDVTHGFRPRGVGFYRKVFALPRRDLGKKLFLEFDGIFRNSSVWLNGHHLADHKSGYTSFHVDITDAARYGAEGMNCLLVRVDATATEGWWYEGCGIYRHVWLTKTSRVHVGRWGTYVTTPRVSPRSASVRVETTLLNETPRPVTTTLVTEILDPQGRRAGVARSRVRVPADGRAVAVQSVRVRNPRLWSPDSPFLYRALSSVKVTGRAADEYSTVFGIRTVKFTPDRGFFLNGRHLPINGTCNHQDFAGVGVALPDSLHEYKIKVLKEMGCNAYRCAHHPPAPELLDACDRLGMLVMDENRRLDSSERGLADLESMLYRDRNHPCVVAWSMENEETLEGTEMGARIVERLARRTRQLDPTRPTASAMNHGHESGGYTEKLDVAGFNYGHNADKDVRHHRLRPKQPIVGTETNATPTTRGIYRDDIKRGMVNAYGTAISPPPYQWNTGFTTAWRSYLKHPFLTGVFIWAGFDYRGEPSPCAWPSVNSHYGILDTCGFPKDAYFYHKAMFLSEPVLHVMPHWTWPGKEGKPIKVWVLTNAEIVALRLNGKPLGVKKVEHGEHLEWLVPYAPGRLEAIAYRGRRIVAQTCVCTAGRPARIALEPDRARIKADGRDAVPVRVSVLDSSGSVVPSADNLVRFSVSGPGRVIGVGNGNPASHEPDKASRRRAFNGLCMAIIQSAKKKGRIVLTAHSAGLKTARCTIKAN